MRKGSYGGDYDRLTQAPQEQQPIPKTPERQPGTAAVELESLSDQDWERAQELHTTREEVYDTLNAGMEGNQAVIEGVHADPKYWKVMKESLQTLGITPKEVESYFGSMEWIMEDAKQNPKVLMENKQYVDTAVEALKYFIQMVRNKEQQHNASESQMTSPWKGMQLRWNAEKERMAAEKVRRGAGPNRDASVEPNPAVEEVAPVEDLQAYREQKGQKESSHGFTFPDVDLHKRDPKYWRQMIQTLSEDSRFLGIGKSVETLIRRIERGDADTILDGEIAKIVANINKKLESPIDLAA